MRSFVDHIKLQNLLQQVEEIEARSGEAGRSGGRSSTQEVVAARLAMDPQWPGATGLLDRGYMHEWFAGVAREAAGGVQEQDNGPPLSILVHLAHCAAHPLVRAERPFAVVWIGRSVWPSVHALIDPADPARRVLRASLLVDPPDAAARLWATDLALRCPAAAAVVADGSGFDMAATRRLQLAAGAGGMAVGLLARPLRERAELSAAATRWLVRPLGVGAGLAGEVSTAPTSGGSPAPRWIVELLRCKGVRARGTAVRANPLAVAGADGTPVADRRCWTVELTHAPLCQCVPAELVGGCGSAPARVESGGGSGGAAWRRAGRVA